jgi:hypothetical protein
MILPSDNEEDVSLLNDFMRTGHFQYSLLGVLKDRNGYLIESNKINRNSVALKDKGKEGTKGVKLIS